MPLSRLHTLLLLASCLSLATLTGASAQTPATEKEPVVRRAVPVDETESNTGATTERKSPAPVASKTETGVSDGPPDKRKITNELGEKKETEKTEEAEEEEKEPEPEPKAPGDDLFDYANIVYGQKYWDLAIEKYTLYLTRHPSGKRAQAAWYRKAESYRNLAMTEDASATFRTILRKYKSGPYVAPAAYRLASMAYQGQKYTQAIPYFKQAAEKAENDAVKLSSMYFQAYCMQMDNKPIGATAVFNRLIDIKENNKWLEEALLQVARLEKKAGKKKDALAKYEELGRVAIKQKNKGEGYVGAAAIHNEDGNTAKAIEYFEKALNLKGSRDVDSWRALARFGLIRLYDSEKNYEKVVETFAKTARVALDDESLRPKMLLTVANAYRKLELYSKAIDLYVTIEQYFPDKPEALSAAYNKLYCLYNLKDPSLPRFADDFVSLQKKVDTRSSKIDSAYLLKGETLFQTKNYKDAATAYAQVRSDKIDQKYLTTYHYKRGWAESESGRNSAAIDSLSNFINENPDDPRMQTALAKRALSYRAVEDLSGCLKDCERILKEFPKTPSAELAYQQKALISGQRGNHDEMVSTFQALLRDFPNTHAKPEAHYWIGSGLWLKEKFAECIAPLTKARDLDPQSFVDKASLKIIFAHYNLQQIEQLSAAIDKFRTESKNAKIPKEIYMWIGSKLFDDGNFAKSNLYLTQASTPNSPKKTKPNIWKRLAEARLELGAYDAALAAADHYMTTAQNAGVEAQAQLYRSQALLGQKEFDKAKDAVEQGLQLQKEGRVNAFLRIQAGDVAMAKKDYAEAAKLYELPALLFKDPVITPTALYKNAQALKLSGNTTEANEVTRKLKRDYPRYRPQKVLGTPTEVAIDQPSTTEKKPLPEEPTPAVDPPKI